MIAVPGKLQIEVSATARGAILVVQRGPRDDCPEIVEIELVDANRVAIAIRAAAKEARAAACGAA